MRRPLLAPYCLSSFVILIWWMICSNILCKFNSNPSSPMVASAWMFTMHTRNRQMMQTDLFSSRPFSPFESDENNLDEDEEESLNNEIDSFLRGEYDKPYDINSPAPNPNLEPGKTIELALRSLRKIDDPEPSHGSAVLLRFCAPLSRGDRWGGASPNDAWKEVLRGAITPTMLARRIRASPFSGLLDWERLSVTEGYSIPPSSKRAELGMGTSVAFVNAAMFFGDGMEPSIIQFTLRKIGRVWLIDTAVISKKEWFVDNEEGQTSRGL
mmetsp:Transcript_40910/g.60078  ORF Transcript_40910/g.60078 Transcript_40910/m.60078 type:complete len:269 (+) Transcript_40910:199-1005(+)|eukprot:CAMPEP_0195515314 /NCGR_PEP_ID=MMETSP0794_2-20130614/6424_1 /TAXON_ID=515487 /ORGANISM="Stephanopyxis turris, Strain CCMP 815" /LENGTH=268 /DNA_ID=CAMNT_0040643717 /DNA_START=194 /DNA_END=1000 /DNA_ORIENTATION=+